MAPSRISTFNSYNICNFSVREHLSFEHTFFRHRCPKCGVSVFEAEKVVTTVGSFHAGCMKCKKCERRLDVISCFAGFDSDIFCKNCYAEEFGVAARRRSRLASRQGSEERDDQGTLHSNLKLIWDAL